jgi:hypothetical protein
MSVSMNATGPINCNQCTRPIEEAEVFVAVLCRLQTVRKGSRHFIEEEDVTNVCYMCQRGVGSGRLRQALEVTRVWNG